MGEFGSNQGSKMLSCSLRGKHDPRKLLAHGCGSLICDERASARMRIISRDRVSGVVSALKRLAGEICTQAHNMRRGSAYVEVWK
ncbi:MAG TPA: hypothetical protein VNL39_15015 [Xanthobacteraceae bacterium]|nr:hypothetical protein [Xanthobacteraceae bacterium]